MASQTSPDGRSTSDQLLDLLLDALVERQKARRAQTQPKPEKEPREAAGVPPARPEPPPAEQQRPPARSQVKPASLKPKAEPQPGDEGWKPSPKQPSIQMGKTIGRLLILVVVLIILVNIPVNRYGISLARILPDSASLIIRDGLVLQGSGPEIYILEEDKLRWISSLDAFEHMGLTWEHVHVVEDEFLESFEKGTPIHVLLKCHDSPHVYRLENGEKRWIKDIDTFQAEGHIWEDVRIRSCQHLRDLPDGKPIPEDAGVPPQP